MKPYTRPDNRGRAIARDDIHHKTADQPRHGAAASAKAARHAARQAGQDQIIADIDVEMDDTIQAPALR